MRRPRDVGACRGSGSRSQWSRSRVGVDPGKRRRHVARALARPGAASRSRRSVGLSEKKRSVCMARASLARLRPEWPARATGADGATGGPRGGWLRTVEAGSRTGRITIMLTISPLAACRRARTPTPSRTGSPAPPRRQAIRPGACSSWRRSTGACASFARANACSTWARPPGAGRSTQRRRSGGQASSLRSSLAPPAS